MRIISRLSWGPALVLLSLTACEPNQLYLVSHTVVGINAGVNPEQTTGTLLIGYDRAFATVIPRSVATTTDGVTTRDAMSSLVCSNLTVEGITIRRYTESIATGIAAKKFAAHLKDSKTPSKVKDFFDCFKDDPPQSQQGQSGGKP